MISIKTVLKKKKLSNGKYPIFLRITKDRKSIYFRTPYICEVNDWDTKQEKFNDNASDYLSKNRLLIKFQSYRQLTFKDITPEILEKYEAWLRANG